MRYQNSLVSNLLTINCVQKLQQWSFSREKTTGLWPVPQSAFPSGLRAAFDGKELPANLYTAFGVAKHGDMIASVDLAESIELHRAFILHLLKDYFTKAGVLMMEGFIGELELYLPTADNDMQFRQFDALKLNIIRNDWSKQLMLQITYTGSTRVMRQPMLQLGEELEPLVSRVVYQGKMYGRKKQPEAAHYHQQEVYAVLSNKLRDAMHLPATYKRTENIYQKQHHHITAFAQQWLRRSDLLQLLKINPDEWVQVPDSHIFHVSYISNNLLIGFPNHTTVISPKGSLGYHGPYSLPAHQQVKFFAIYQESDRDIANELFKALNNFSVRNNHMWMPGKDKSLYDFIRLKFMPDLELSLKFQNPDSMLSELETHLDHQLFDHQKNRYVAIYVSPISRLSHSKQQKNLYYSVKEMLLKYKISLQVIERDKIGKPDFRKYYIHNLAPAILAKAGGIPWQLERTYPLELIVGVGAFRNSENGLQYIGSAFSFNSNGTMRQFNCITKNELFVLAGDIREYILQHIKEFGRPDRLIIHYHKTMSNKELKPITTMLHQLKLDDIPVFILSISKTLSADYLLFDHTFPQLLPKSGTIAQITTHQYLLFNNTRYNNTNEKIESFYYPLRMKISCTQPQLLENKATVKTLIEQVYQFSRVYWKSVKQQNLPITVSYPAMLAEIYSHFKDEHLNEFARSNLWFL